MISDHGRSWRKDDWPALSAIVCAALAFRLALLPLLRNRPTHDLRIFSSWAHLLTVYGFHGLYNHVDAIDHLPVNYPPLFGLILAAVNGLYEFSVRHNGPNAAILSMLLKLPAVIADVVSCIIVFAIVRGWFGRREAIIAAAIAAFAPSSWPISAVWGQVDSLCTVFMVLSLACLYRRRYAIAWCTIGLAILIKPLPLVLLPLLTVVQLRDQGWTWRLAVGPAAAAAIAYAVSLPFIVTRSPLAVFRWLVRQYSSGQAFTDETSVNAYNIWTLASPVRSDATLFLGIPLHAWGWSLFIIVLVSVAVSLSARAYDYRGSVSHQQLIVRSWFVVLAALFILQTRMHERYILFALALAPLMYFCGRVERRVAILYIATFTICVILVLGVYEHSWLPESPMVTHVLSALNVIAFVFIAQSFFIDRRYQPKAVGPPGGADR